LIFAVIQAVDDGSGTTVNYWAEVDVDVSSTNQRKRQSSGCAATHGQELFQPDNIQWSQSPSSWAFTSAIHSTLTSCTYTNTAPTEATATGTLTCPDLPSAVACPPVTAASQGVCLTQVNGFSLPGIPGIEFGGSVASTELLSYCEW
jgi:hypothetical protein